LCNACHRPLPAPIPDREDLVTARLTAAICATGLLSILPLSAQEVSFVLPSGAEDLRDPIEQSAQSNRLTNSDTPPTPSDLIAATRADYLSILQTLYSAGHYGPEISIRVDGREASSIGPLEAPARIDTIVVTVDPGPRFVFGQTDIAPLAPATELPETFRSGETAESGIIADAVDASIDTWRAAGHAKADIGTESITARHTDSVLDIDVTLVPGPRLTFGAINVTGNVDVRTERVLAIAGLRPGLQYSPQLLDDAQRRLRRSGTFQTIAITEADTPGPGDTLDIEILAVEMPKRRIGFGAEFSSLDGASANAFWLHRNLFGGAETFRAEAEVVGLEGRSAGPDAEVTLNFTRPATRNPDTDLTAEFTAFYIDEPDFLFEGFGLEVGFVRYARADLTFTGEVGVLYAYADTPFGDAEYLLLTAPLSARLDRRDNALNSREGYLIDLEATPFLGLVNSDSGARIYGDARYYLSFGERLTLATRGQFGTVLASAIDRTPSDYLFYSGGTETVRGQPYNSLGATVEVTNDDGTVSLASYGGKSFVGAQLEARVGVTGSIDAVGFYDIGIVDAAQFPSDDANWHAGAGVGVRYNTPIGPIRLDIATPVGNGETFDGFEFYIGIGQTF
jgi:translocation and assembly module TamA